MEQLREKLVESGVARDTVEAMDKEQLKNLAKAFNINPVEYLPRTVEIVTGKNGARYVVTEGYVVPKYKNQKEVAGETSLAKNLYTRVEAIDKQVEDLLIAKGLLEKE
ncbi:hypothetical protein LCGC14_2615270 [marine sediment metagenome]|uniref:Uncharacterized protein n=1 Tax=marine sediment metagenome TaxID=412755 RepID=A0A0F9ASC2_9ZZZZ